jgi:hypothetical protein
MTLTDYGYYREDCFQQQVRSITLDAIHVEHVLKYFIKIVSTTSNTFKIFFAGTLHWFFIIHPDKNITM